MGDEAVLLKTDIRNAFNSRRRDQMLEILFEHPELAPIWRMAYWAYKDSSSLLVFENGKYKATIESAQGVKQGDALGALLYALSVHSFYKNCTPPGEDKVRKIAIMDDLNLVGAFKPVFEAFDRFEASLVGSGLEMRRD